MKHNLQLELDDMLSKAIYVSGTPLAIVEHPLWQEFFKRLRPSYKLPTRKKVSSTLLDSQYGKMKAAVDDEIKSASVLHLQCDGWSNVRNEPILNFIITQPKPFFVDSIATKKNRHTGDYLGTQIESMIEKYGSEKFYSVIGDNARNMQAGLKKGTAKFPHIETSGCIPHALHNSCKDILKTSSAGKVFGQAKFIINKIKKSHRLNSVFMEKQAEKKIQVALKLPPETRWGYSLQALQSLKANSGVLKIMAVDTELDEMDGTNTDAVDTLEMPGQVKKLILDDQFWHKIDDLIELLQPIVVCLTQLEGDDLIIHKSYENLTQMFATVQGLAQSSVVLDARDKTAVIKSMNDRKNGVLKPLMIAAAILDPACMGANLTQEEIMNGIQFIFESAEKNNVDQAAVMTQLTNYRAKKDIWSKEFLWISCEKVKPTVWWKSFFGCTELGVMADKILTTPLTSAATERSFSTFSFIHTKKRNRLTTERASKITYIAHNYKLMNASAKKRTSHASEEPSSKRAKIASSSSDSNTESSSDDLDE